MASKNKIIIHEDELNNIGVDIMPLHGLTFTDLELHRDDHYMFIIQKSGHFVCEVDFNKIVLRDTAVCFVGPGQVQRYIKTQKCEGWLLFADTDLISKQFRESFDAVLNVTQHASLLKNDLIFAFASNLGKWWLHENGSEDLKFPITKSLLDALSGMIAYKLLGASTSLHRINSPKHVTATRFKQLIKERFKELKEVKQYASLLHITPLYLNEIMNEMTGFAPSYWIHQEIILEAKRLLFHSDKDIRAIAWELGYEDYAYFSRFFKKNTGITPSAFRDQKP